MRYGVDWASVLGVDEVSAGDPVPWRRFGERPVYESPEVRLAQIDVGLPTHERIWLHVVRVPMSVAVALIDDSDRVLLLWRYRFIQERWGWELPGGQVDDDEGPAEAAFRELDELTGYRAGSLEHLLTYQPMPELADGERFVMVGRDPTLSGEPVGLDTGARVEWVPMTSVPGLIIDGLIWDGTSIAGLLSLLAKRL